MDFSERLTALMRERGVSERALAAQVTCHRSYIHMLRTGQRRPGETIAQRIDDALNAEGELVALIPRRSVLAGGVLAVADSLLFGAAAEGDRLRWAARHPLRIDAEMVDSLAGVLAAQRRAEDRLGVKAVMPAVLAQFTSIEELVGQARGPLRPELVNVAQQWAQFVAYLHRDAGDAEGDRARLAQALEWADEVGDRTMAATVFVQRGNMALAAGEVGAAIGLAQAAQRVPSIDVGQRAEGADLEGKAYAYAGDGVMAERKLGEAAELAGQLGQAQGRPWLYWMTPDFFQCARGAAFGMLASDPRYRRRAADELEGGFARLPGDQQGSSWTGVFLAHLAAVHVRGGDVGQAAAVALRCAEIARVTESERLSAMLASVHARMRAEWPSDARVSELGEAIR